MSLKKQDKSIMSFNDTSKIKIKNDKDIKKIQIDVPREVHSRFKSICSLKSEKMTDILLNLIKEWIKNNG